MSEFRLLPGSLMNLWSSAYQWMISQSMPITDQQRAWIKEYPPSVDFSNHTQKNMAYYITEHFENLKWPEMPDHIKQIIQDYKIHTMQEWEWPEWGYKDVMHLKPEVIDNVEVAQR